MKILNCEIKRGIKYPENVDFYRNGECFITISRSHILVMDKNRLLFYATIAIGKHWHFGVGVGRRQIINKYSKASHTDE